MTTYTITKTSYHTDNTAEFGYGDFGETRTRELGNVVAPTLRKAQNLAKKTWPSERLSFSGISQDWIRAQEAD